jgi:hypothetical protein
MCEHLQGRGDALAHYSSSHPPPHHIAPCRRSPTVGEPLAVERTEHPSREQVDALHGAYCDALRQLYDRHKEEHAPNRKRDMRFVL